MLTLAAPASRPEVYVLRRGATVCGEGEPARRALSQRLARSVAEPALVASFDGGVTAYPPGAVHQVSLAGWVRSHLESQLDAALADQLVRELAGIRLALRPDLAPEPLDEADRRMVAALAEPRRLDEIWPLARVPRFRLLAFVHFARSTGALVAPSRARPRHGSRRSRRSMPGGGPRSGSSRSTALPTPRPSSARTAGSPARSTRICSPRRTTGGAGCSSVGSPR